MRIQNEGWKLGLLTIALATGGHAEDHLDTVRLLKSLSRSKHTLADGIREAARSPDEAPISAKFELDGKGRLSLSIYTAGKGLKVDAEHNVLQELAGSPEEKAWMPEVEVFKDVEHVARASQQLTLMAISPFSLSDILAKVDKERAEGVLGTPYAITPLLRDGKPCFEVPMAIGDNVNAGGADVYYYDMVTGKRLNDPPKD